MFWTFTIIRRFSFITTMAAGMLGPTLNKSSQLSLRDGHIRMESTKRQTSAYEGKLRMILKWHIHFNWIRIKVRTITFME